MGSDGSGRGVEAEGGRGLGAVPKRPMAMVRRARLHLGERRNLGLDSLSSWPLDSQRRSRLGLGAGRFARVQTGRCVLAIQRETGRMGTARTGRRLGAFSGA